MDTKKQKREKQNKIFIGVIITIFLVSSIGGVILYRTDDTANTAGMTKLNLSGKEYFFEQKADTNGNLYYSVTDTSNSVFSVYYLPQQLISLPLTGQMKSLILDSGYYFLSFDPEDAGINYIDFLRFELRNNIPSDRYFVDSVTRETDTYPLPVITCENATVQSPVLILSLTANATNATVENNCIKLDFAQYDLFRVRDSLIYLSRGIEIK